MKKILKYEIKQLLRDKKTIIFIFILPLVVFPLINGILSKAVETKIESITEERFEIVALRNNLLEEVFRRAGRESGFSVEYITEISNTDSLLEIYPAVVTVLHNDSLGTDEILVSYSAKKDRQSIQARNVLKELRDVKDEIKVERYREIGVDNYFEDSVPAVSNISSRQDVANSRASGFLPVTIIMVLLIGTFTISNYVILGEKDNNTLEALVSSGVRRSGIIYGKMTVVIIAGLIMSLLSVISLIMYSVFTGTVVVDIMIDPAGTVLFIAVITGLSVFISSFSVLVSCKLKSSSSGQLAFLPLMLLFLVLSLMGIFEGVSISRGFMLIPVINSSGVIKSIIAGNYSIVAVTVTTGLNFLYSFLIVRASSDYLGGDEILDKNSDMDFARKGFSKGEVLTIYALLVVLYMMIGGYLQSKNIVTGLILSQIFILGGFVLIMSHISNIGLKRLLHLKFFRTKYLYAAILLGITARYPISLISEKISYIFPVPKVFEHTNILSGDIGGINIVYAFIIISVLPAIFEESVFRGVFFKIMEKRFSRTGLIVATGLMFGGIHLNIFSFFETSVLGILLGLLVLLSGSIFPSMVMHFINNAFSLSIMKMIESGKIDSESWIFTNETLAYSMSILTVLIIVLLLKRK
ncbi:MAG: ABC transporter permease [Candidatus Delongbacteria bacterium]